MTTRMPIRAMAAIAILGLLGTISGCNSGFVKAKGKVVKDGEPLKVRVGDRAKIVFYPYSESGSPDDSFKASLQPGGTFEMLGKTGKGIPIGKYRIAIDGAPGDMASPKSPVV